MIIVHPIFTKPIIFEENQVYVLVVEHKECYQNMVYDILNQIDGEEGDFSLFIGDSEMKMYKHVDIVTDLFNIDINQSKYLTKLYGDIKSFYIQGEHYSKYLDLSQSIINFMSDVLENFEYDIEYAEQIDVASLLKSLSVKFVIEGKSILEKLINYISILNKYFDIKLFVVPNLRSILSHDELKEFYKFINYNKYYILLLDSHCLEIGLDNEKICIIDNDLCVID